MYVFQLLRTFSTSGSHSLLEGSKITLLSLYSCCHFNMLRSKILHLCFAAVRNSGQSSALIWVYLVEALVLISSVSFFPCICVFLVYLFLQLSGRHGAFSCREKGEKVSPLLGLFLPGFLLLMANLTYFHCFLKGQSVAILPLAFPVTLLS